MKSIFETENSPWGHPFNIEFVFEVFQCQSLKTVEFILFFEKPPNFLQRDLHLTHLLNSNPTQHIPDPFQLPLKPPIRRLLRSLRIPKLTLLGTPHKVQLLRHKATGNAPQLRPYIRDLLAEDLLVEELELLVVRLALVGRAQAVRGQQGQD